LPHHQADHGIHSAALAALPRDPGWMNRQQQEVIEYLRTEN
jgi:hypothetical protein